MHALAQCMCVYACDRRVFFFLSPFIVALLPHRLRFREDAVRSSPAHRGATVFTDARHSAAHVRTTSVPACAMAAASHGCSHCLRTPTVRWCSRCRRKPQSCEFGISVRLLHLCARATLRDTALCVALLCGAHRRVRHDRAQRGHHCDVALGPGSQFPVRAARRSRGAAACVTDGRAPAEARFCHAVLT